jgi:hypothetical protein
MHAGCQFVSGEMDRVRLYPVRCPSRGDVLMYLCLCVPVSMRYDTILFKGPHGAVGVVGGALATCVLLPQGCVSGLAIGLSIVGSYL